MRKGMRLLTDIAVQLLMAAAIIGLIMIPIADRIITGDTFRESAYATENALTLEAMQIADRGDMRVAYLFQSEQFFFTLGDGLFTASTSPKGGVARHFLVNDNMEVSELRFQPNFFQYHHQANTTGKDGVISTSAQTFKLECPAVTIIPGWPVEGRIALVDNSVFSRDEVVQETIRTAIAQAVGSRARIEIMQPGFAQQEFFSVMVSTGDNILVENDPWVVKYEPTSEHSHRYACTLAKELSGLNADLVHIEEKSTISNVGGVDIFVPKGFAANMNDAQQRELSRAITAATVRFLEGDT